MKCSDKWLFPDDEELTTLQVTLPQEDVAAIDDAVDRLGPLKDQEDFIFWSVQYALASLKEEAAAVTLSPEKGDGTTVEPPVEDGY